MEGFGSPCPNIVKHMSLYFTQYSKSMNRDMELLQIQQSVLLGTQR